MIFWKECWERGSQMRNNKKLVNGILAFVFIAAFFMGGLDVKGEEPQSAQPENANAESENTADGASPISENKDESAPLEGEPSATPRGPAPIVTKYVLTGMSGRMPGDMIKKETFDQSAQSFNDRYTGRAKNTYTGKDLKFSVRQTGTNGSVTIISPECKVTVGDIYDTSTGVGGGVAEFSRDYLVTDISPETKELNIQCIMGTSYTGGRPRRIIRNIIIPIANTLGNAPESPEIVFDPQHPDSYVLTGTDTSMEYTSFNDPYRSAHQWEACTGQDIILNPGTCELFYLVRYKGTDSHEASNYKQLKLPIRGQAPRVTLDRGKEVITGLTTDMEYCIGNEAYTPVTEALVQGNISNIIDNVTGSSVEMKIRFGAKEVPASFESKITLYKRADTPKNLVFDSKTFKLSGVSNAMEYLLDTSDTWKYIPGNYLYLDSYGSPDREVIVKVRYRHTNSASKSKPVTVTLPMLKEAPKGLTINYTAETIEGFEAGINYQYTTDSMGYYSDIWLTNGVWNINPLILINKDNNIYIRKAATANTALSASSNIMIPGRKASPANDIKFVYNDPSTRDSQALMINVNTLTEYWFTGGRLNTCTGEQMAISIPVKEMVYNFREKATNNSFKTGTKTVRLKTYGARTPFSASDENESIFNLHPYMEYRINDGDFQSVGDIKSIQLTEAADSLSEGETYRVSIRTKRTEDNPAGVTSILTVYPRPAPPKGVSYDTSTYILSGVTSKMQYREMGTSNWIDLKGPVNLKALVTGRPANIQIEVRVKNYAGIYASYPVTVNLYD